MPIYDKRTLHWSKKSDEELLNMERDGEVEAREILAVRMFRLKDKIAEKLCLDTNRYLDKWEINEAFFIAYLNAEKNFDPTKGIKFLTYLCEAFRNQANAFAKKAMIQRENIACISLDQTISIDGGSSTNHELFCDSRPSDITSQIGVSDILATVASSPTPFPPYHQDLLIRLSEGYTVPEAARSLGISPHKARATLKQIKLYLTEVEKAYEKRVKENVN